MAYWPNHGEDDPRPALGSAYRDIEPVLLKNPAEPDDAPAALRLPIVGALTAAGPVRRTGPGREGVGGRAPLPVQPPRSLTTSSSSSTTGHSTPS